MPLIRQDIVAGKTLLSGLQQFFRRGSDEKRFLTKFAELIKLDTTREKIISLIKFNYKLSECTVPFMDVVTLKIGIEYSRASLKIPWVERKPLRKLMA